MPEKRTRHYDRGHLDQRLGTAMEEAARHSRRVAVLVIAADGVAWVNRRWGRAAGDSVLRKLARLLAARLASGDAVARYAGNRFGVIRSVTSVGDALEFGQAMVRDVAEAPFKLPGRRDAALLSISVGAVLATPPGDAANLIAGAEAALRHAKDAGGNRVIVADAGGISGPRRGAL